MKHFVFALFFLFFSSGFCFCISSEENKDDPSVSLVSKEDTSVNTYSFPDWKNMYKVRVSGNMFNLNPEFSPLSHALQQGIIGNRKNEKNASRTFFSNENTREDMGTPFE
ncbi:MAG: hypothetical protein PHQ52_01635 [Candidatus Omnitrophica bacterium]|nr:hypothetical protein [Candidatus Omnitrophota bacterium]